MVVKHESPHPPTQSDRSVRETRITTSVCCTRKSGVTHVFTRGTKSETRYPCTPAAESASSADQPKCIACGACVAGCAGGACGACGASDAFRCLTPEAAWGGGPDPTQHPMRCMRCMRCLRCMRCMLFGVIRRKGMEPVTGRGTLPPVTGGTQQPLRQVRRKGMEPEIARGKSWTFSEA